MKRTILKVAAVTIFVSTFASCGNNQNGNDKTTEDALTANLAQFVATSTTDNPAVYLSLVKSTETDSSMVYVGKSLNDKDTLGLQIEIIKDISAGIFEDGMVIKENAYHNEAIKLSSVAGKTTKLMKPIRA